MTSSWSGGEKQSNNSVRLKSTLDGYLEQTAAGQLDSGGVYSAGWFTTAFLINLAQ